MSAKQLTQLDRSSIEKAMLEQRFCQDHERLVARCHAHGVKAYERVFTQNERAKMEGLPAGWLPETRHLEIQFGAEVDQVEMATPMRVPYEKKGAIVLVLDANDPLAMEHEEILRDIDSLDELESRTRTQIKAVLYSVTSLAALLKAWPEAEPFCTFLREDFHLPAPPIADLNRLLRLTAAPSTT